MIFLFYQYVQLDFYQCVQGGIVWIFLPLCLRPEKVRWRQGFLSPRHGLRRQGLDKRIEIFQEKKLLVFFLLQYSSQSTHARRGTAFLKCGQLLRGVRRSKYWFAFDIRSHSGIRNAIHEEAQKPLARLDSPWSVQHVIVKAFRTQL